MPSPALSCSPGSAAAVVAILPPYFHENWLGGGVVRVAHELAGNGVPVRLPRLMADVRAVPPEVEQAALHTLALQRDLEQRRRGTEDLARRHPAFFEEVLGTLLAGGERVFLLSTWRTNADVTLELCRQLKQRRPEAVIVLGGPEAIERGDELLDPAVDVVVRGAGEGVVVPLVRAILDGRPGRARRLAHCTVAPQHADDGGALAPGQPLAALGPMDMAALVPLVVADRRPRLPVVLNVGCVFNCGFCTNRMVYPTLQWGEVERAVEEIRRLGVAWREAGAPAPLKVELCDAALNGWPEQFRRFVQAVGALPAADRPRLSANMIVDQRLDAAVIEEMLEAGLSDMFFGLESGSARLRRAMKKPGQIERVWEALVELDARSAGRLRVDYGVIVGWPDETEAEYQETLGVLEAVSRLDALSPTAWVSPFLRSASAQGAEQLPPLQGDTYGVLWRSAGPAGDPAVRARRLLGVADRFQGLMGVDSSVPIELLARWMLPDQDPVFRGRWERRWRGGAREEAAAVPAARVPVVPVPPALDAARLRRLFGEGEGHRVEVEVGPDLGRVRVAAPDGAELATLLVRPLDLAADCYARTGSLNVSLPGQVHAPEVLAGIERLLAGLRAREQAEAG